MRWQDWLASGQIVSLLGHDIFVRTQLNPNKPPLLLIHGFPTSSMDFHHIWDGLAQRWSLLTLDLLGFGLSAKPVDGPYRISFQADLCVALIAHLAIIRPRILAHDYGVTVTQELLARQLEGTVQLEAVDFLNGGLFPEAHRPRLLQKLLALPVLGPLLVRFMRFERYAASMRSIAGEMPPTPAELHEQWTLLCRAQGLLVMPRLLGYMAERRQHRARWVAALQRSTLPLRLICGAADPISGAHLAERFAQLLPLARVHLLQGVGHYPQLEAPGPVLAALLAVR
jgi:pimeloyl-ACP methyl ester carboxylesterase